MRPPFGYYGGKQPLADWIVSLMPPHQTYVEPFAGSLAVLLAKPPAPVEVVNDLDGEVVNFWRVLRDRPHDLERVCALTPYARAEYDAAFDPTDEPLERARRWWTRIEQSVAHTHSRSGWNSAGARFVATARNHVDRMGPAAERIAQVAIDCRDAVDVIDQFDGPDTLIYCDPPYVAATHSSRGRTAMAWTTPHIVASRTGSSPAPARSWCPATRRASTTSCSPAGTSTSGPTGRIPPTAAARASRPWRSCGPTAPLVARPRSSTR